MGLRDRLMRWLARGSVEERDPDAIVEVGEFMLHEGPMLIAALERAGIQAHGVEAWDLVTKSTTRMRIFTRAADATRALDVIHASGARLARRLY